VEEILDIWPPLPLVIYDFDDGPADQAEMDNLIAALERNDRVCHIKLGCFSSPDITESAAMHKPFPELTELDLGTFPGPVLPDSYLGGTAPRLRFLYLDQIPFPGLPKLLLSATHLVHLSLDDIPRSGYIPPEVMATVLSASTSLESLHLQLGYPPLRPPLPPLTRAILPSLRAILFRGASEYLEEILARIDTPQLDDLDITFFKQTIFDTPQLFQFISRRPTLSTMEEGCIAFSSEAVIVKFPSDTYDRAGLSVKIRCPSREWQLSSVKQLCTSSLPPVSTLEDLYIFELLGAELFWQGDVEDALWPEILRPFVAVKNLFISDELAYCIAPALQELVGARTTEVLPALENIYLEELPPSGPRLIGIKKFVAARQLTGHPVPVFPWYRDLEPNSCWYNTFLT
jgi:hypothetical protein